MNIADKIDKTPLTESAIKEALALMIKDSQKEYDESDNKDEWAMPPAKLIRHNLGYMLGYYDKETREAWYKYLPDVNHPIFGEHFGRTFNPTPEMAFKAGQNFAKKSGDNPSK